MPSSAVSASCKRTVLAKTLCLVVLTLANLGACDGRAVAAAAAASPDSAVKQPVTLLPQLAAVLQLQSLRRCAGVRGAHCIKYYAQPLMPVMPPHVRSQPCPRNCSGLGVCNGATGLCDCPAGVGGQDCSTPDLRPCTNRYRTDRSSSTPASHIGPNKRDIDWAATGWTPSRCAGVCDDATAICYCDGPHHGRVPAPEGSPPGTPAVQSGRLLHGNCQRLRSDDKGQPLRWGALHAGMTYEDIYGAQGWCTVDRPRVRCSCDIDGLDGELCELVTESVCPNQCSGHGICQRGFCACLRGWYGADCAHLSDPAALAVPAPSQPGQPGSSGDNRGDADADIDGDGQADSSDGGFFADEEEAADAEAAIAAAEQSLVWEKVRGRSRSREGRGGGSSGVTTSSRHTAPLPQHKQLLAARPWLRLLAVDVWERTSQAATTAARRRDDNSGSRSRSSSDSISSAEADTERTGPVLPAIYYSPLPYDASSSNSSSSTWRDSAATVQALAEATAVDVGHNDAMMTRHAQRRARQLQRHFWTGGGGRRSAHGPVPRQETVARAVHQWLSATSSNAATVSSASVTAAGTASDGAITNSSNASSLAAYLAAAGVQLSRLESASNAVTLQRMLELALSGSALPHGMTRRPRIFVYDMPSRFVGRLLQYRPSKATCSWRVFSKSNYTIYTTSDSDTAWRYPLESHLHELLLQSPHRTLNPEEADYFYVPVYASCFMEAVAGWADTPWWGVQSRSLVKQGVRMYGEALAHIRASYPYWNASRGADHVWLFAHDEGSCWAPAEIYESSLILTQWGRLPPRDGQEADDAATAAAAAAAAAARGAAGSRPVVRNMTVSSTSRWEFNYNAGDDTGDLAAIGHHACYTPGKDLVLPAFKPPPRYAASPYLGGDVRRARDILLLLVGDLGSGRSPQFSLGLRQHVTRLAVNGRWRAKHGVWIGQPGALQGDRSSLFARARFCLVLPRDGWSGLFEDAVLHGCVPVVVSGGTYGGLAQPLSAVLRLGGGMIKLRPDELHQLPELLKAVGLEREAAMRRVLGQVWSRFAWLSHPHVRASAESVVKYNLRRHTWIADAESARRSTATAALERTGSGAGAATAPPVGETELLETSLWSPEAPLDDALDTLMQWLHHRLLHPYFGSGAKKQHSRLSGTAAL